MEFKIYSFKYLQEYFNNIRRNINLCFINFVNVANRWHKMNLNNHVNSWLGLLSTKSNETKLECFIQNLTVKSTSY